MPEYQFYVPFTQEQLILASGQIYGSVEAETLEEAEKKIQKLATEYALGNGFPVPDMNIDSQEDRLEMSSSEPMEFDYNEIVITQ